MADSTERQYDPAFRLERRAQLARQGPQVLLAATALIATYNLFTGLLIVNLPWQHLLLLIIEAVIPLAGVAVVGLPLAQRHPEPTLLLLDVLFTTVVQLEFLLPNPDATGLALSLGLKIAGTALIFPWAPGWQAASVLYTLAAFAGGLYAGRVAIGAHVLVAPVLGGLISVVGVMIIETHRRALYRQQIESAESEAKYRSLAEGTVAGVFVYQDDTFRFVNEACARMLGYGRDELTGQSNHKLHRPDDLAIVRRIVEELESGARGSVESLLRAYRRDGREMFGRASYSRILFEGRPAVLGVVIDVTTEREQQHAAERLAEEVRVSEARYRDLFENSTDIIVETDSEGYFVAANHAALTLAGFAETGLPHGLKLSQVVAPEYLPVAYQFRSALLAGQPVEQPHTVPLLAADGSRRAIELHTRLIRHPERPPTLQSIGRDVTERQAHFIASQRMVAFQRALTATASSLHSPLSLDQLYQQTVNTCRELFGVTMVRLWSCEGDTLVGRAASGQLADQITNWRVSISAPTLPAQALHERRAIYVNDLAHSEWRAHAIARYGAQAWMAIPLLSGDRALGVLVLLDHANPAPFSEQSVEWGHIFASQVVLAIENARLRDRERAEARSTTLLLELAQRLHAHLGDPKMHILLAAESARILECDIASIVVWQPDRRRFRVAHVEGLSDEQQAELEGVEFEPLTAAVFSSSVRQFNRKQAATPTVSMLMQRWGVEQVLYLPIRREDTFLAMLVFGQRAQRVFSPDDVRLAEGIAYHAAIALENVRLLNALQSANRLKSEFVATMSHELRSPLNVVMGYTDLLREGQFGPVTVEQTDALDRVFQQSDQLLQLINTTLDLSRLERGEINVALEEFALSDLLDELQTELTSRPAASGAELTFHPVTGMAQLHTDRGKLKLVIRNLVDNALKFTETGTVEVVAEQRNGHVEIRVRDTGTGIAAESLHAVFEMFRQVDASDRRVRGGVGLGLYIVRRLVTMLGGEVDVESTIGVGSTFRVTIPLRADAE